MTEPWQAGPGSGRDFNMTTFRPERILVAVDFGEASSHALRLAGSLADVASRLSGRSLPLGREGLEIATRWRPIADSPGVTELGVSWREPHETLSDLYRWMAEAGAVRPGAVPKLVAPAS